MKLPQHRAFFLLVILHALEDVGKHADGCDGVGSLIEHDAFGAFTHGGVGNFRSRRESPSLPDSLTLV